MIPRKKSQSFNSYLGKWISTTLNVYITAGLFFRVVTNVQRDLSKDSMYTSHKTRENVKCNESCHLSWFTFLEKVLRSMESSCINFMHANNSVTFVSERYALFLTLTHKKNVFQCAFCCSREKQCTELYNKSFV